MSAVLTPDPAGVPAYLANQPRWLLWREVQRTGKDGTITRTKLPIAYRTGQACNAHDLRNWALFHEVVAALTRAPRAWDGIAFDLGHIPALGEYTIGADLDACLDDAGDIKEWAQAFLAIMPTYTEISPGGQGLKLIARIRATDLEVARIKLGISPGEWARSRGFGPRLSGADHASTATLFLNLRFFTITGRHWAAAPEDVHLLGPDELAAIGRFFGAQPRPDEHAHEVAIRARLAAAFLRNPKLKARWEGGTEGLKDTTRSARDFSVVRMLKADGFAKEEAHAALQLFEHGKAKDEGDRYFDRMWERTTATPAEAADFSAIWNPWEDKPPPTWPEGILPPKTERTLARIAQRDGIDCGLLNTTVLAAGSAAAPKNARFYPYQHAGWAVPPILWIMVIGESGSRKTRLEALAFSAVREMHREAWRRYEELYAKWEQTPKKERSEFPPPQPHSFLMADTTPEALQEVLAASPRGTAMVWDELSAFFDFGRYKNGQGAAERAFYLSAYEDIGHAVHRISRRSRYVEHTGLSIYGGIQPRRLSAFQADMETDGLLQRFLFIHARPPVQTDPSIDAGDGIVALHEHLRKLCEFSGIPPYHTTAEGTDLIRQTETLGSELAVISEYGPGWPGFCSKLHGTHARLALVLHLLEAPEQTVIPTDTIERAATLLRYFLLLHAIDFFDALPGSYRNANHDIAGWLLNRGPDDVTEVERILASDLTNAVKSCRKLGSKGVADALDPFVTGGWLTPETDYPNNRAWFFNPAIRRHFITQSRQERERRAHVRALIGRVESRNS
jgi:Protein of unknown function (DUF3987)